MAKRKSLTEDLFGWLGRQVGHVKKAVKADVKAKPAPKQKVVYRDNKVEEAPHPTDPAVKLPMTAPAGE